MIRLINGSERDRYPYEIDAMHCLRKRVFHDRLGWDVPVDGTWEIDEYDDLNPLYVIAMDDRDERVVGSLRLLPTTGPNMLANTFSQLLDPGETVASGSIWESSRYCVDTAMIDEIGTNGVHKATIELLCALAEIGMAAGLTHIVTVIDRNMERLLRRINCPGEWIGEPKRIGKVTAIAGLWETNEKMLRRLQSAGGWSAPVLAHKPSVAMVA